jgi:hypothetical protein
MDSRPYVLPDAGTGVMDGQEQFCLLGNVFEVTYQRSTVLATLEVLVGTQVRVCLE